MISCTQYFQEQHKTNYIKIKPYEVLDSNSKISINGNFGRVNIAKLSPIFIDMMCDLKLKLGNLKFKSKTTVTKVLLFDNKFSSKITYTHHFDSYLITSSCSEFKSHNSHGVFMIKLYFSIFPISFCVSNYTTLRPVKLLPFLSETITLLV